MLVAAAAAGLAIPLAGGVAPVATAAAGAPAVSTSAPAAGAPDVLVARDAAGNVMRPDAARTSGQVRAGVTTSLTFTYSSPSEPWSAGDLAWLQQAVAAIYPVAQAVAGPPAFSNVVNIRKCAACGDGSYNQYSNEIVLSSARADLLAHEMVHALRDDYVIASNWCWEEGMTRAAEVEILDRLPQYATGYWDDHHSYYYDEGYDFLNRQAVGSYAGNVWSGYNALVRYQLCGYAWGKALIERPGFLATFNSAYYAAMAATGSQTEAQLVTLAAAAAPTVEGLPFRGWYREQGALVSRPPMGTFIMFRSIFGLDLAVMQRTADGWESFPANVPLRWTLVGSANQVLLSGTGTTGNGGYYAVPMPGDMPYSGRARLDVTATVPNGPTVSDNVLTFFGSQSLPQAGVYGIVAKMTTGTVTVRKLDAPTRTVTVPVVNGAFSAPTLAGVRGRFLATFTAPGQPTFARQFTKDEADYAVLLAAPDLRVTLTDSRDPVAVGSGVTYTARVTNLGPTAANGTTVIVSLPAGSAATAMSSSQGSCAAYMMSSDRVVCFLGGMNKGASATVRVTEVPTARGTVRVTATVAASEVDRITANNSVTQATTVR